MHKSITILAMSSLITALCFGETTSSIEKEKPATTSTKKAVVGEWTQEFEAAMELAAEKKLPMFLNFTGSDWCGWCILMERQVFSTREWQKYAKENLVLVKLDFPRRTKLPDRIVAQNKELQTKYKVTGYPTFYIVSHDGEKILGRMGASQDATPEIFIGKLRELLQPMKIAALEGENKAKYDALAQERDKIEKEASDWRDTKPDMKNALNKRKESEFKKRLVEANAKIDDLLSKAK
jgi:Thiol:disulfide interchange protein